MTALETRSVIELQEQEHSSEAVAGLSLRVSPVSLTTEASSSLMIVTLTFPGFGRRIRSVRRKGRDSPPNRCYAGAAGRARVSVRQLAPTLREAPARRGSRLSRLACMSRSLRLIPLTAQL
jgi:hypothetical protein